MVQPQAGINEAVVPDWLRNHELPTLAPGAVHLLHEMIGCEAVDDAVRLIEYEPLLTARVIGLANSAWSSPVAAVTTTTGACARLGLDVVRSLCVAQLVGARFDLGLCPAFDRVRFWVQAIIRAHLAADFGRYLDLDRGTCRSAGLLRDIGLLWIAAAAPVETQQVLSSPETDGSLDERLRAACGVGHLEAGRWLLLHWELPQDLADAVACSPGRRSTSSDGGAVIQVPDGREVGRNIQREGAGERLGELVLHVSRIAAAIHGGATEIDCSTLPGDGERTAAIVSRCRREYPRTLALGRLLFGATMA